MKKKFIIIIPIIIVLTIIIYLLIFNNKSTAFYLENEYYKSSDIVEIKLNDFNNLIDSKESFGIFIYQPMCSTSSNFEQVIYDFQNQYQIKFFKIAFSSIKDTKNINFLKYYPSFIIYKDGQMIDFLEADKKEDTSIYQSVDSFKEWFTKYVKLKDTNYTPIDESQNLNYSEDNSSIVDISLDNIVREENKVNIYFFWGNGCPHCEEEFAFLNSIEKEYGKYYNLYTFETWYDEENAKLLNVFATAMGDKVTGVPYTIIGDKSFSGFTSSYENDFKNAIINQYNNSFDVYFDKINK
ncbi:MAG: hypothetical protein Q4G04_01905 [bacterium]|nr:hypothetical protein [bacterium]